MQRELSHISDLLDTRGLREEDELRFIPLFGRKRRFKLLRSKVEFVSDNVPDRASLGYYKPLDVLGGERMRYRLELVKTLGRNNSLKRRYRLRTIEGAPFRHNGNYVNEAFLQRGDKVEMGHNTLEVFAGSEDSEDGLPLDEEQRKFVHSSLPVLLTGETGTGKTTLAKKIHRLSRPDRPFVHLNISAFSSGLLESELFGHVKGAFTGAIRDKMGAFREARNGTLFIDEIDSLPLGVQTKLLVFLDEFKIRPVGAESERQVECRLICASGTDLKRLVSAGKMRKDFYYRIASGLLVELPSLRYNEDFIERMCHAYTLENKLTLTPELIDFYKTLPWPGNLRQLYGHLEKKAVASNSSRLSYDNLDKELAMESSDLLALTYMDEEEGPYTLEDVKREYVKSIYFKCGQNMAATAKRLAISPRSVKSLLAKSA